jgi:hypothetical protein
MFNLDPDLIAMAVFVESKDEDEDVAAVPAEGSSSSFIHEETEAVEEAGEEDV